MCAQSSWLSLYLFRFFFSLKALYPTYFGLREENNRFNLPIKGRWSCGKTSHTTYCCESTNSWHVVPKVLSLYAWLQNLKAFSNMRKGKRVKKKKQMWSVFLPTSNLISLIFCYPHFLYQNLTDGVGLVDRVFAEICDHNLFTCQSIYIEKLAYRITGAI